MRSDALPSAASLGLARLVHLATTDSTMDIVHRLAEQGAPAGTLVVADSQTRGRGRAGKVWVSGKGAGLWMTLLDRPVDHSSSGVLALRVGMAVADALEPFVHGQIRLKWPNDLFVDGKLAGILVEARWRDATIDWVAIGVGVNMRAPGTEVTASCVEPDVTRAALLPALVTALRKATARSGRLSAAELQCWDARDLARGRHLVSPVPGTVLGIATDGALLVRDADGSTVSVSSGSMLFADAMGEPIASATVHEPVKQRDTDC